MKTRGRKPRTKPGIQVAVGQRIRALRQHRGWSQEKLAEESNLHRTYIGGVERGERNVSILNVDRISKSLGVSIRELFEER